MVVMADMHYRIGKSIHVNPEPFLNFLAYWKPQIIVFDGDMNDYDYIAKFNKRYIKYIGQEKINSYIKSDTDYTHDFIGKVIDIAKPEEVHFIDGNHEERVHIYQKVIGDIQQKTTADWLRLDELGVTYTPFGGVLKKGKLHIMHGEGYSGETSCRKAFIENHCNMVLAHDHKSMIYPGFSKMANCSDIIVYKIPSFSQTTKFDWINKMSSNWNNGFGYGYIKDTGNYSFYIVNMSPKGKFILFDREWE